MSSAPELEVLYQEYQVEGLIVVTAMTGGPAVDLEAWANTYDLTFPITMDTAGLAGDWGVTAIPAAHLLTRGGVIQGTNIHVTAELIEEALAL